MLSRVMLGRLASLGLFVAIVGGWIVLADDDDYGFDAFFDEFCTFDFASSIILVEFK